MSEQCVRCGEEGEDRRTLWHSCLYAMNELNVPFEQVKVVGSTHDKIGDKEFWIGDEAECRRQGFKPHLLPEFSEEPTGQFKTAMFRLRVCKQCRSDWMGAIEHWFNNVEPRRRVGTGLFVRKKGATVEVTHEEWEKMRGN
jgi:hypothetical protein